MMTVHEAVKELARIDRERSVVRKASIAPEVKDRLLAELADAERGVNFQAGGVISTFKTTEVPAKGK